MPNLNHISVEIDAAFGTRFQEESALAALQKLMQAWQEFYHSKHAKNAIKFHVTRVETIPPSVRSSTGSATKAIR